jgi:hypothetical protein
LGAQLLELLRTVPEGSHGVQLIYALFDCSNHMVQISIPGTGVFFPLLIYMSSKRRPQAGQACKPENPSPLFGVEEEERVWGPTVLTFHFHH